MKIISVLAYDRPVLMAINEIRVLDLKENDYGKGNYVSIRTKNGGEFRFPRHVDSYDKALMYIRENAVSLVLKG